MFIRVGEVIIKRLFWPKRGVVVWGGGDEAPPYTQRAGCRSGGGLRIREKDSPPPLSGKARWSRSERWGSRALRETRQGNAREINLGPDSEARGGGGAQRERRLGEKSPSVGTDWLQVRIGIRIRIRWRRRRRCGELRAFVSLAHSLAVPSSFFPPVLLLLLPDSMSGNEALPAPTAPLGAGEESDSAISAAAALAKQD